MAGLNTEAAPWAPPAAVAQPLNLDAAAWTPSEDSCLTALAASQPSADAPLDTGDGGVGGAGDDYDDDDEANLAEIEAAIAATEVESFLDTQGRLTNHATLAEDVHVTAVCARCITLHLRSHHPRAPQV